VIKNSEEQLTHDPNFAYFSPACAARTGDNNRKRERVI